MSQEDEIKQSLNLIQKAVLALDKKIEAQGKRIRQLEENVGVSTLEQSVQQEQFASFEVPSPSVPVFADVATEERKDFVKETAIPEFSNKQEMSLEENIAGNWFMRIGITALILGISFFLKYAFDNNWIGETGRVLIGILIGLGMLGIGEKTIRKYAAYGQAISGAGVAVLYLSIFSAFNYYHLINSFVAFFAMIVITAVGISLSFRYDALSLLLVAIVGGFATPLLASNGQNNQFGLFSYIALLDIAILSISVFKKWREINFAGFIGTAILFLTWVENFYTKQDLGTTMLFLTLFFVIYSISSLIYNLAEKELSTGTEQALTLFSAFFYFGSSYAFLGQDYASLMGFFAILLAIYYFLWAYAVRSLTPEDENLYTFLAFLTVGFVTLAIPIQFKQNIVTISWAIEALLLTVIGAKLKRNYFVVFSFVVTVLTLFRYFFLDNLSYDKYTITVFNSIFLTATILVACLYLMAYVMRAFADEKVGFIDRKTLMTIFFIMANFLSVFAVGREIDVSYNQEITAVSLMQSNLAAKSKTLNGKIGSSSSYYQTPEYKQNQEKINNLRSSNSIALSIFWLVYSVGAIAFGMVRGSKRVRVGGIVLLSLAIWKLFFIDLWSLGTLYRIISSISLGLVLLLISFVYQKYRDVIKKII